jgi:hypothetical protein
MLGMRQPSLRLAVDRATFIALGVRFDDRAARHCRPAPRARVIHLTSTGGDRQDRRLTSPRRAMRRALSSTARLGGPSGMEGGSRDAQRDQ